MSTFSTYESLSSWLEGFADQIDEIEAWHSGWQKDERIRANIMTVDHGMTKKACFTIIVSAQAVHTAVHLVQTAESWNLPKLLANGMVMPPLDWLPVLDHHNEAGCFPVEYQFGVVMNILRIAREAVRQFADNLMEILRAGALGEQGRLVLQDHVAFHLEEMTNGFLILQGLLEHDLGRRFADVPILMHRLERTLTELKSVFVVPPLPSDQ